MLPVEHNYHMCHNISVDYLPAAAAAGAKLELLMDSPSSPKLNVEYYCNFVGVAAAAAVIDMQHYCDDYLIRDIFAMSVQVSRTVVVDAAAAPVVVDDVLNDYFVMMVNKSVAVVDGPEQWDDAEEAVMLATAVMANHLDTIVRPLMFPKNTRTHGLQKRKFKNRPPTKTMSDDI